MSRMSALLAVLLVSIFGNCAYAQAEATSNDKAESLEYIESFIQRRNKDYLENVQIIDNVVTVGYLLEDDYLSLVSGFYLEGFDPDTLTVAEIKDMEDNLKAEYLDADKKNLLEVLSALNKGYRHVYVFPDGKS